MVFVLKSIQEHRCPLCWSRGQDTTYTSPFWVVPAYFYFLYLKSAYLFILLSILRQFHCVALDAWSSRVPRLSVLGAQGKLPVSELFSFRLTVPHSCIAVVVCSHLAQGELSVVCEESSLRAHLSCSTLELPRFSI